MKTTYSKIIQPKMFILLTVTLLFGMITLSKPVSAASTVFAAPVVVDTSLTPGSTFYINLTVANVEHLWGFQFSLKYNTTVLTAIGYESYEPFTLQMPIDINDESGYVAAASTMLYGEPVGFSTFDPAAVARLDFVVDSEGISMLRFDRNFTQLVTVYAGDIPFVAEDGFFSNIALPAHDVAVTEVTVSPNTVAAGGSVVIDLIVLNQGTEPETFDVAAKYDSNEIGTQTVTNLASGASETLSFVWNTTGVILGTYTIEVLASTVEGEVNTGNNHLIDGNVTVTRRLQPPVASMTWEPQTPYVGENVTFDASASYDPDGTILTYLWHFGDNTSPVEETDPFTMHIFRAAGTFKVTLQVVDNDTLFSTVRASLTVLPGLEVKLSSPLDYFWRERVKVRLSALVTEAGSERRVSDATVTLQIYDPNGNLWISDVMVEKLAGTGIYEWESSETIEHLQLAKGVYLVHVEASRGGSPAASDILEFHIDPPAEESSGVPVYYLALPAIAFAAVAAALLLRRRRTKVETHHRIVRIAPRP